MRYSIDSGVLIEAAKGPYRFKMVPQFWQYLHTLIEAGVCRMVRAAYEEICDEEYGDDLEAWCKARKNFCYNEDLAVQDRFGRIAAHVQQKEGARQQRVKDFLGDADPWVIALAMAHTEDNCAVVTHEKESPSKGKIKIPTICGDFDVRCLSLSQMLEELDADLSGGGKK